MTFFEFMNGIYQIILDRLKEQTFTILLLMGAAAFFYFHWQKTETKLEDKILNIETALVDCNTERGKLAVTVAQLQAKFDIFSKEKGKKR